MECREGIDLKEKIRDILSKRKKKLLSGEGVPAAILIPIFKKKEAYHILFTKRTDMVEHHKGQISFPGGIKEERDSDFRETVLREVFEEIGLLRRDVEIIGELDDMETTTGFRVSPFVGFIPCPYDLKISRAEIEELIEVPFSFFMKKENLREEKWVHEGKERDIYVYQFDHHRIWGATARILKGFIDLF